MEAGWLALTTLLTAVIVAGGALLTTHLNARQIRQGKEQDYDRQDAVAAQAAEAARLLAERQDAIEKKAIETARLLLTAQKESIERTDEVARLAAAVAERTTAKLDAIDAQGKVIHTLVNQKLTNVTEQALLATIALLPHLEEAMARMRGAGIKPTAEDIKRVEDTKRSIVDLQAILGKREQQQAEVDADRTEN